MYTSYFIIQTLGTCQYGSQCDISRKTRVRFMLLYVYLILNTRMFILDGYHGKRQSYHIKRILSNTL